MPSRWTILRASLVTGAALALPASALGATLGYEFVDRPIPDGEGVRGATINMTGAPPSTISDVDALVRINHPRTRQLAIRLKGPDGTTVSLSKRSTRGRKLGEGACQNPPQASTDFPDFLIFNDEGAPLSTGTAPYAGGFSPPYTQSFRPRSPLSAFDGTSFSGNWTFKVRDLRDGKVGTLECVRLVFNG